MKLSWYARTILRESRGSVRRLIFFIVCLAVGVAAVVSVAGFSASMDRSLRLKARELLAADLVVESRRPLPVELDAELAVWPDAERTDIREMVTLVAGAGTGNQASGTSHLAELKVVDGRYPYYGRLTLSPDTTLDALIDDRQVVVARELMQRLSLVPGDALRIGGVGFTVAGVVEQEPDRINISFSSIAPRVFLSPSGLEATGLETRGSRIRYRALIKLRDEATRSDVEDAATTLRHRLPDPAYLNIETYLEAQPTLRKGLEQANSYLGLVALVSLLIGGIGVSQTVRAWLATRIDSIAVLKCLGVRPREVIGLYLGQAALLGLVGSVIGVLAGLAAQSIAPLLVREFLPMAEIRLWQPTAILRGLLLGTGVATLFSLPPLWETRRVAPVLALRRDAEPLPADRLTRGLTLAGIVAGVLIVAVIQSESLVLGAEFTGLIGGVLAMLALAALMLTRAVSRWPRRLSRVWVRHGMAALARPGAGTLGAISALGLGVAVVLAMYVVETHLSDQLSTNIPADAPTAFVVDIQPDQLTGVRELLEAHGATRFDSVPMVNSRLVSVDGIPVEQLVDANSDGDRKWVLTREQRLTYMEQLPDDNEIIEGELWGLDDRDEVSVERDFAVDMGARLGSLLVFDVQGVPVELTVGSIRTVDWETFGVNFFLVVEPGVLDDAPQFSVAAVRLPAGSEQEVQDRLAAGFPNVTMLQIRQILDRVVAILGNAGLGVRLLGGFTVLAGVLILGGVVSTGSIRRGREVALFKTLGMTRRGVMAVYAVEYALIGTVAGVIGAAGGTLVAAVVLEQWMEISWQPDPAALGLAVAGTLLLAVIAGIGASLSALARRPVEVLRNE